MTVLARARSAHVPSRPRMPEQVQFASVAGYGTKSRSAILEALMDVRYQCAYRDRSKDSFDESLVRGAFGAAKTLPGRLRCTARFVVAAIR